MENKKICIKRPSPAPKEGVSVHAMSYLVWQPFRKEKLKETAIKKATMNFGCRNISTHKYWSYFKLLFEGCLCFDPLYVARASITGPPAKAVYTLQRGANTLLHHPDSCP